MNDLQQFNGNATNQTPIEIALQVDSDGTISARGVYDFLGLRSGKFVRWARTHITENEFALKNEDYIRRDIVVPAPTNELSTLEDYRLSVSFAKKLCMLQRNERGEQARDYFIRVENTLKTVAQNAPQLTTNERFLQLAQNAVELEREIKEVKAQTANNAAELKELKTQLEKTNFILPETTEAFDENFLTPTTLYTTTEIGKAFGISARAVNKYLFKQGVLIPERRGWKLHTQYENCNYVYQKTGNFKVRTGKKEEHLMTWWTATGKDFLCSILLRAGLKQKRQITPYDRHASRTRRVHEAKQLSLSFEKGGVSND